MTERTKYTWATTGDLNAFFGLMLDNVANLVVLTGILSGVFGFPACFVFTHMIPGTALGVLFGDLVYTWMAFRLAKRTGRSDVTAMPLGLDTPSTIGIAFAVLGPVYLQSHDPMVTWQVGMATMVFMGIIKLGFSFAGNWIQKIVPQAGLLGSLAGIGIALLGVLPLMKLFNLPVVGMVSFGLVLYTLVSRLRLPGRLGKLPGAAAAVVLGTLLYYVLGEAGLLGDAYKLPEVTFALTPPLPTLGFIDGLGRAVDFLPVAIPFGLLTIVGGINVTESARVAGDDYSTRNILLTEAIATLVAGVTGGVAQSTPYIGHPAYKAMGGRAGYTLACGLFIGIGGAFGFVSSLAAAIPEAAVVPILIFIGLEIVSQTFVVCPRNHYPAVALSFLPIGTYLVLVQWKTLLGSDLAVLPAAQAAEYQVVAALGNGFILTAMLWGAFGAHLAERRLFKSSMFLLVCAVLSLCGMIHSVDPDGKLYLPWLAGSDLPWRIAAGYTIFAVMLLAFAALVPREKATGDPGG